MTASSELSASPRTLIGKASTKLAHSDQIPAVLYGHGREPLSLSLYLHDFNLFVQHHGGGSTLVELKIEGEKKPVNAMLREVQHNPVKGTPIHVDFVAVSMTEVTHAIVPVHLINDPAGVKAGGVLTVVMHEVNISAKPGDIPESLEADVAALEIGDSLHVKDIVVPEGVEITDDTEAVVASVQAPRVETEEEEGAVAAEPELIGSKGDEE
jgi:large subunit ribosomal protein L25